ncbi:MAG TPA: hypothetical protein VMI56_13035 [Reyranella sp.]|nr:hypothetical protein [Reyranella sp.]
MKAHNLDIHPAGDIVALYPGISALADNTLVKRAFDRYEAAANRSKAVYHRYGALSVWLIAASAIYSVAYGIFDLEFPGRFHVSLFFAACAAVALAIQVWFWRARPKNAWLVARYAAERVRSIKFQGFTTVFTAGDAGDLAARADAYYGAALAELESELNGDVAVLRAFKSDEAIDLVDEPAQPASPALYDNARRAFRALRLDYEERFARSAVEALEERGHLWRGSADYLFVTGALLVLVTIVARAYGFDHAVQRVLEFVAVSVFILSASLALLEHASLAAVSEQRYREYGRDLEKVRVQVDAAKLGLRAEIEATERLALRELQEFCTSALLISYRI